MTDIGLFGPDTVTWKVNREAVLLAGGGRALLLQVAHPSVAAGVVPSGRSVRSSSLSAPAKRLRASSGGISLFQRVQMLSVVRRSATSATRLSASQISS